MADYSDAYLTDKELAVKYSRPASLNATSTAQEWAAWFAAERDYCYQQWLNWQAITLDISTKVGHLEAEVERLTPREIQHQEVSVYAALPIGSVVMDARRDVYERWTDGWVVTDLAETEYQDDGDMEFPLTVLHVPEVQS